MSLLDNVQVEDASADEAKITRNRASAAPDAGVVALLKSTLSADASFKKITLPDEASVKKLVNAVKVAAASEGIGYRVKVEGTTLFVKGAPKKSYNISAETLAARAEKSRATRAAKAKKSGK